MDFLDTMAGYARIGLAAMAIALPSSAAAASQAETQAAIRSILSDGKPVPQSKAEFLRSPLAKNDVLKAQYLREVINDPYYEQFNDHFVGARYLIIGNYIVMAHPRPGLHIGVYFSNRALFDHGTFGLDNDYASPDSDGVLDDIVDEWTGEKPKGSEKDKIFALKNERNSESDNDDLDAAVRSVNILSKQKIQ